MMHLRQDHVRLWFLGLIVSSGCVGPSISPRPPEPREIGRDIAVYQVPERPSDQTLTAPEEPSGALTLRDAIGLALMHNPRLEAFAWEVRAREALTIQAGLRPNPELDIEVENVAGSGDFGGVESAEMTVGLSQILELGGKRTKRRQVAQLEQELAAWDYETLRIDVLTEATKSFVQVLAAQERVSLAEDLIRVAEQVLESVARRVRAGAVSPVEETRARVELATNRVEREIVLHELTAARTHLAATWGSNMPRFSAAMGDLESTTPPPTLEVLSQSIEQNPHLARLSTELESQRAAVAFEKALRAPDLSLGAGVRRFSETDDTALVLGAALPLLVFDRNQGAARAADNRLARVQAESRAAAVEVRAELATVYEEFGATYGEVVALRDAILPEAQLASDTVRDAYMRGLFGFTDVLEAQRNLYELRGRYFEALARYHVAKANLERLIAEPLENLPR